jgi:hypothetical protein
MASEKFNAEEAAELFEARTGETSNNPRARTRKHPCPLCDGKRLHKRNCPVAILIAMRADLPSDGVSELTF